MSEHVEIFSNHQTLEIQNLRQPALLGTHCSYAEFVMSSQSKTDQGLKLMLAQGEYKMYRNSKFSV